MSLEFMVCFLIAFAFWATVYLTIKFGFYLWDQRQRRKFHERVRKNVHGL